LKRLSGFLPALGLLVSLVVPSAQAGEWRVGGGAFPYYHGYGEGLGFGTGVLLSADAQYVWKRHMRFYGRMTYGHKSAAPGFNSGINTQTLMAGVEFFFKPFYIGYGMGVAQAPELWETWWLDTQTWQVDEKFWVGRTRTSFRQSELPIGIELHIMKNGYLRGDLWRSFGFTGWNLGEQRTITFLYKI